MSKSPLYRFCQSSFMYNHLQSYKDKALVVDTRNPDAFVFHAISASINISNDHIHDLSVEKKEKIEAQDLTIPKINEMLNPASKLKFATRRRCYCFVIVAEEELPKELVDNISKLSGAEPLQDYYDVKQEKVQEDIEKAIANMEEKDAIMLGLKVYNLMLEDKVRELYILTEGAENFFKRYEYMDPTYHPSPQHFIRSNSLIASKMDITFNFPNDILDNRLFLGSFNQASQEVIINCLHITHILNATAECGNVLEPKGIKYLHLILLDETGVSVIQFFKEAYEFIDTALNSEKNNKLLIHCALGKSRSATLMIMYLMKKFNWTAAKALDYVRSRRAIVDPNYGFLGQLEEFEKHHWDFVQECEDVKN